MHTVLRYAPWLILVSYTLQLSGSEHLPDALLAQPEDPRGLRGGVILGIPLHKCARYLSAKVGARLAVLLADRTRRSSVHRCALPFAEQVARIRPASEKGRWR